MCIVHCTRQLGSLLYWAGLNCIAIENLLQESSLHIALLLSKCIATKWSTPHHTALLHCCIAALPELNHHVVASSRGAPGTAQWPSGAGEANQRLHYNSLFIKIHLSPHRNAIPSLHCTFLRWLIFYWTALYCDGSTVHYCVRLIRGYKTFTVVPTSNGSAVPTACWQTFKGGSKSEALLTILCKHQWWEMPWWW